MARGGEDKTEGEKSEAVWEGSCRRPGPEPRGGGSRSAGPTGDQEPEARRQEAEGACRRAGEQGGRRQGA